MDFRVSNSWLLRDVRSKPPPEGWAVGLKPAEQIGIASVELLV